MSEETPQARPPVPPTPATTSGTVTRDQQRRATAEQDAIDDSDKTTATDNRRQKDKEAFKGTVDKMNGNVFQLAEEGRKGNQYTQTLEALLNYVNRELEFAKDLAPLFEIPCTKVTLITPDDLPPFDPKEPLNRVTRDHRLYIAWKFDCETYNSRVLALESNQLKIFTIILLQCSQSVTLKLQSTDGYDGAKATNDCEWLITSLKNICHKFEHTENRFVALTNAKAAIFNYRQGPTQHTTEYYEALKELIAILESYGGQLHDPEGAAPESANIKDIVRAKARNNYMRERYFAIMLIRNSDNHRFDDLKQELSNAFSRGRDEYPTTLVEAHQMLLAHKPSSQLPPWKQLPPAWNRGTQRSESGRGYSGRSSSPGRGSRSGRSFAQIGFSLAQVDNHFPNGIPKHFILLDSDSTVSIFCNPDLLTDIHDVDEPLYLETNGGGHQISTQMGTIKNFGTVWYNPDSIANILSLAQVRQTRRITMDTNEAPAFHVHKPDRSGTTIFSEHESGLYLHDASSPTTLIDNHSNSPVIAYSYLQTVAHNKSKFTVRQIEAADSARKLYRLLGRPGYTRFLSALKNNHILNCPITVDDAKRAEQIYGKDVAFLKGKTTANAATDHIPDHLPIPLPEELLSLHPNITLCIDIFYILGLAFSLSTSRSIHYLSSHYLPDRSKSSIQNSISYDLSLYKNRGFNPTAIHADGEYNTFRDSFPPIHFSICSADTHVPEIERAIRTVKESIRATIHGMPYSHLPRVLVKELVTHATNTINMLPHPDGVSDTLSPNTIITGHHQPDYNHMPLEFGTYVQVYDGTSSDTKSRTLGAIATTPTNNSSGDHYFMSLATGCRIHRRSWTVLPISDAVISRVEAIALNENMPAVNNGHILPEYDPDEIVDPSTYDRNYIPPGTADPTSDHELTSDAYTDTSDSDDESTDDNGHHPDFDDDLPPAPPILNPPNPPIIDNNEERLQPANNEERTTVQIEERVPNKERDITPTIQLEERTAPPPILNEERQNTPIPATTRREGLRPSHPPNYQHKFGFTQLSGTPSPIISTIQQAITSMPPVDPTYTTHSASQLKIIQKALVGLMFTQMSASKGIKKHGASAIAALKKEFEQFKALDVLEPLDAFTMSDEDKAESLRALSVIKEKRDSSIKGRTCADGSKQQGKFSKAETGSPTVSNDALFLTVLIDAYERRDVATADIAGAYLHALMKEFISMRFVGWAVDLLCEVNPEYKQYVVYEGKVKVLYVRCNKAIYGCVVSGILWYELFSSTLEAHGFTTNPYDFCIANATIDGSQCTIAWFVDDTKISHANPNVVTSIINLLEARFGKMKVTRGASHKFLGMNIQFLADGTATIHMPSYIQEAIDESGLQISESATTPCANNLLTIDASSPLLPPAKAKTFHSIVAKLIYVGTRARTDILLALSFLCGRVSNPTEQDEKKLKRLLSYLNGTIDLPLTLGADSLHHFSTWVDASYAVHPDMRSHTGGVISFGRGSLICKSKKQNINTKSSTEAELIGASDYLPHTLYVKLFMEAQGYPITVATFHQDNESAIKMEQNGKASCGQHSRHIDIRYFFITDHSKRNNIHITHCATEDMLADFFTKPLQGALFRKFRSVLLGSNHIDTLCFGSSSSMNEERVESNKHPGDDSIPDASSSYSVTTNSYPITTNNNKDSINSVNTSHSIEKYPEDK